MTVKVSLKTLLETGAHFGHATRRWDPKMAEYLHGSQDGVHIFDLLKTKKALEEALEILSKASQEGKSIVIVGTKKQAREKVREIAEEAGCFSVTERWLGGTITNFPQIQKSTRKLKEMKEGMESGGYDEYTKKERVLLDREIVRLERFFGGIAELEDTPDLLLVVDVKKEKGAIKEARMAGIETIGIVDSNSDPISVDYPIPMNDDATKAIHYVLELIRDAILEGKKKTTKKKAAVKGKKSEKETKTAKKTKAVEKKEE